MCFAYSSIIIFLFVAPLLCLVLNMRNIMVLLVPIPFVTYSVFAISTSNFMVIFCLFSTMAFISVMFSLQYSGIFFSKLDVIPKFKLTSLFNFIFYTGTRKTDRYQKVLKLMQALLHMFI